MGDSRRSDCADGDYRTCMAWSNEWGAGVPEVGERRQGGSFLTAAQAMEHGQVGPPHDGARLSPNRERQHAAGTLTTHLVRGCGPRAVLTQQCLGAREAVLMHRCCSNKASHVWLTQAVDRFKAQLLGSFMQAFVSKSNFCLTQRGDSMLDS